MRMMQESMSTFGSQIHSNKNPQNGGLIVWKKTPNLNASFNDFNSLKSIDKMSKEVENSEYIKVPYQSNRVVIFQLKTLSCY